MGHLYIIGARRPGEQASYPRNVHHVEGRSEPQGAPPVERRIEALKRFWEIFDDLHARQKSGMPSLWGLVDDYGHLFPEVLYRGGNPRDAERPHRPGLYRTLLPESLRHEMEQLWGTTMLLGYPGRIVSEPLPVVRMAEAFGPALEFWEGTALTAWFLCEGPYSRTNMRGLERYHAKALDYLEKLGTPVEKTVFEDLTTEETHLGPEKEADLSLSNREVVPGTIVQIGASYVYGREGFERLREVVTRSRRAWAEKNLDRYLRARPEAEIRRAATAYNLTTLRRRGKPPTLKQFAKDAEKAARLWFGGDMAMLYRAFGEEPSFESTPSHLLPKDVAAFAADVYQALGGEKLPPLSWRNAQQLEREAYEKRQRRERARASLATKAIGYVQVMEALGRSPTFKEFARLGSPSGLEYAIREALDQEPSEAYSAYATIVEQALAGA